MSYFDIYESRGHGMYPEGVPLDGDDFIIPEETSGMVGSADVTSPMFDDVIEENLEKFEADESFNKKVDVALDRNKIVMVANTVGGKTLGQIRSFDQGFNQGYEPRHAEESEKIDDSYNNKGEEDMLISRSFAPTRIGPASEDDIPEGKDVILDSEGSISDEGISDIEVKNGNGDTMAAAGPDVVVDEGVPVPGAPAKAGFPFGTLIAVGVVGLLLWKMGLKK